MMRRLVVLCLASLLAVALCGCSGLFAPEREGTGSLHIVISPAERGATSLLKEIPSAAEKVRIRIWNAVSGYNDVVSVALAPQAQALDIAIPARTGYTVDILSYDYVGYAVALTGGRAAGVSVVANEVTDVAVTLRRWGVDVLGPEAIVPGDTYSLTFIPTDGGGLLTSTTFATGTLRASLTDFGNPATPLPGVSGQPVHVQDDRFVLSAVAPAVTQASTLYAAVLIQFTQDWYDYEIPNAGERAMFLELPNRHLADDLREVIVNPTAGGVEIVVSGKR
jgi:hypothetical protein